jgi:thiamine biosynthesis lipoprotein
VAAGRPPESGWRVGIEDPAGRGLAGAEPVAGVALAAGAVATSSVSVRRWTSPDGDPVHHLIDPRTGTSARTGLLAVTVAGPDPAWSEVWSKALFLAGRAAIGDEARRRGMAAWWIDAGGRLGMTPAARQRSAWVAEWRLGG